MVYKRGLITDLETLVASMAKEKGIGIAEPRKVVKSFLAKLMTHVVRDIVMEAFNLERPGLLWIPALKAFLPLYWQVVESIDTRKLAEWCLEFVRTGKIPEEAMETVKSKMIELLKKPLEELKKELPPERFVKFKEGISALMEIAIKGLHRTLTPEYSFLAKFAPAIATAPA